MPQEIIRRRQHEALIILAHPKSTPSQRELAIRFLNQWGQA